MNRCVFAVGGALLAVTLHADLTICVGDDWVPLDFRHEIYGGSALDFSDMGLQDAPAGKHGWPKVVGSHVEFERRPGVAQRFWGVNVCQTANFLDEDTVEWFVTQLVRMGCNALRLHHHDGGWAASAENRDRFDRLIAACVRKGIYLFTDLYVSRPLTWRDIGVDRDGLSAHPKTWMQIWKPAYENWKAFARWFLTHRNPYTGRSLAEEPALPFIVLINESSCHNGWNELRKEPLMQEEWRKWLTAERVKNPACYPDFSPDEIAGEGKWWDESAADFVRGAFVASLEERFVTAAKQFLREELGVKALVAGQNFGPAITPVMSMRARAYDFNDVHHYIDHSRKAPAKSGLTAVVNGTNPLMPNDDKVANVAHCRIWGMPMTVSEYNFCGPNPYRSMGGLLVGSLAAIQDWTGVWLFAYAHSAAKLRSDRVAAPGRFDLALDPVMAAAERTAALLYLRRDMPSARMRIASMFDLRARDPSRPRTFRPEPAWRHACGGIAWRTQTGLSFGEDRVPEGARAINAFDHHYETNVLADVIWSDDPHVAIDSADGTLTVQTDRTVGGFGRAGGTIKAGPLSVHISGADATVVASALDGQNIASSGRILVMHLTDVQGEGMTYRDKAMSGIVRWGKTGACLIRRGSAAIDLSISNPEEICVWALDTTGRHLRRVPCVSTQRGVAFSAEIGDAVRPASIYYEVCRSPLRASGRSL